MQMAGEEPPFLAELPFMAAVIAAIGRQGQGFGHLTGRDSRRTWKGDPMDWMAPVDLYCERMSHGLWAEPINAISNVAFLVAAGICFATLKRGGRSDPPVLALIAIIAAIGVGSFLFHIFANVWSLIADIAPITLFIYFYLGLALRRFFAVRWPATVAALALFLALSWPLEALLSPLLVGSAGYVPPLAAMV